MVLGTERPTGPSWRTRRSVSEDTPLFIEQEIPCHLLSCVDEGIPLSPHLTLPNRNGLLGKGDWGGTWSQRGRRVSFLRGGRKPLDPISKSSQIGDISSVNYHFGGSVPLVLNYPFTPINLPTQLVRCF